MSRADEVIAWIIVALIGMTAFLPIWKNSLRWRRKGSTKDNDPSEKTG